MKKQDTHSSTNAVPSEAELERQKNTFIEKLIEIVRKREKTESGLPNNVAPNAATHDTQNPVAQ
jgi:hypothetical protein